MISELCVAFVSPEVWDFHRSLCPPPLWCPYYVEERGKSSWYLYCEDSFIEWFLGSVKHPIYWGGGGGQNYCTLSVYGSPFTTGKGERSIYHVYPCTVWTPLPFSRGEGGGLLISDWVIPSTSTWTGDKLPNLISLGLTFPANTEVGPDSHMESELSLNDPDQTQVKVPLASREVRSNCGSTSRLGTTTNGTTTNTEDVNSNLPSGTVPNSSGKSCSWHAPAIVSMIWL